MHKGTTLLELMAVVAIMAVLAGVAIPRAAKMVDRLNATAARTEVVEVFAVARHAAILRAEPATVKISAAAASVMVLVGHDTVMIRRLGVSYGVRVTTNRDSITYNSLGLGRGAANATLVLARGQIAESVVVSRLGRVR